MHRLAVRDDGLQRIGRVVEVADDPLRDLHRDIGVFRRKPLDRAVVLVRHGVERGDVEAGQFRRGVKKRLFGVVSRLFHIPVEMREFDQSVLPLPDREHVEKVRDRLGVIGAGAAADDDRVFLAAIAAVKRDAREVEHVQGGRVAHLVLQRHPDDIEIGQGVAALERGQGDAVGLHLLAHIGRRSEHPLAPDIGGGVQALVEDAHPEVAHPDRVDLGKNEGKADLDVRLVFFDFVEFPADVRRGFGDRFQDAVQPIETVILFHVISFPVSGQASSLPRPSFPVRRRARSKEGSGRARRARTPTPGSARRDSG